MAKYIFVTGGVVSSLGKGITAASIGCLLKERGVRVNMLKIDPYLNVDPGTMSPYQHGEVYVTADGAETDLDLGHYERFLHQDFGRENNITAGQIYDAIIKKERKGEFLGKTVQVVPHVTNEIKSRIKNLSKNHDVVIVEIGGTVGDIESLPFLEAARQFRHDYERNDVLYIHITMVPYIKAAHEVKTKPTQHPVMQLREIGIQPDIIVCRSEKPFPEEIKSKISLFCNVKEDAVIDEPDIDTIIYEVPLFLQTQGLDKIVANFLKLKIKNNRMYKWRALIDGYKAATKTVRIAIAGKYTELQDAYKSISRSLEHAAVKYRIKIDILYVDVECSNLKEQLLSCDGILVPGGFGDRGIEGKIKSIELARTHKIPFFGICLGMQCAVIEFARNVLKFRDAHSTEFNPKTIHPVIDLMQEQKLIDNLGGTMRLGEYRCKLKKGSKAQKYYKSNIIRERHRHRFEFNNRYMEMFEQHGMIISGINPERNLVEIIELKSHPWFVASQFHPEFKSRLLYSHPLFDGFVEAAIKTSKK